MSGKVKSPPVAATTGRAKTEKPQSKIDHLLDNSSVLESPAGVMIANGCGLPVYRAPVICTAVSSWHYSVRCKQTQPAVSVNSFFVAPGLWTGINLQGLAIERGANAASENEEAHDER